MAFTFYKCFDKSTTQRHFTVLHRTTYEKVVKKHHSDLLRFWIEPCDKQFLHLRKLNSLPPVQITWSSSWICCMLQLLERTHNPKFVTNPINFKIGAVHNWEKNQERCMCVNIHTMVLTAQRQVCATIHMQPLWHSYLPEKLLQAYFCPRYHLNQAVKNQA